MKTHQGGCHCGKVRFEVRADIESLIDCDCSICTKKGVLHHAVEDDQFTLLSGEEDLSRYEFGTHTAKHYFCKHCGIHSFGISRVTERYTVNARCLDDYDAIVALVTIEKFDGKNHPSDRAP